MGDAAPAVNAWVSSAGAVTTPHYDMEHNVFVQVHGRKRFTLFPPSEFAKFGLYPASHPHWRQSTLCVFVCVCLCACQFICCSGIRERLCVRVRPATAQLTDPFDLNATSVLFPLFRNVSAYSVDLSPGDVLYVPPMWFHTVKSLTPSISVRLPVL